MTKKRRRIVGTPSGQGRVLREGQYLADVSYSLQVIQEYIVVSGSAGDEEIESLREITAQISVISGEKDLGLGQQLTLELDDGRSWEFITKTRDHASGTYQAVNASRDGLVVADSNSTG